MIVYKEKPPSHAQNCKNLTKSDFMEHISIVYPSQKLKPYINHFIFPHFPLQYIRQEDQGRLQVLPSPSSSIILFFSEPSMLVQKQSLEKYCEFGLVGYYSAPKTIIRNSTLDQMIIQFTPVGIQQLLEFQLHEITDQFITIKEIFPQNYNELINIINECETNKERATSFESFIYNKLQKVKSTDNRVAPLLEYIKSKNGTDNIKDISHALYIGERTIQRLILNNTGITFKMLSKLIRFQAARNYLSQKKLDNNLSDIAYELNYFDQAHFIHDFKSFSSLTPTQFIKKIKTNKLFDAPNQISRKDSLH